ncbi:PSD1 and planctomycete cytochrome C domain-containing protein [Prosthecobacter sp.]|uniref:PSD1 and planctomycete cytochrome C domain-containing protein n=1 Tax=Prosthecobacter sp. TaxID=1965333 RepID=UPI001D233173|nr:PSD1 and planctomycete cytochrome C domain-containing protein [Prosthecobacter sp.]MCB1275742.1 PSD1 domain-containing protein [Prosthecobacter sp.]
MRPFTPSILLHSLGLFVTGVVCATEMTAEQRSFFESKIRPVLVKQCYECHSVDAKKLGGKLLLDAPSEMIAGGESGPSLIPGKPDESLIIQALRYDGLEMPPKKPLPASVIADFVTWVKLGAPDPREELPKTAKAASKPAQEPLWSLKPVAAPKPPAVKNKAWPRGTIDSFVLAKMEAKGLQPAADADRRTLLRRLSFDLVGLPPSDTSDVSDLSDYVDSLLASPHFGERWGRHWLDVARYAESNGNDGLSRNPSFPHAWRYRDYVIAAFNEDTPYDRFITEQIAGDLLPAESDAQRDRQLIATAFLALSAKPAKAMNDNFEMDVVADQIGVVGSGIMALSVGCARCHDHKTDPIPTRDYYALAGIFKSSETMWGAAAHQSLTAPQTALHELKAAKPLKPRAEIEQIILDNPPRRAPSKPAFKYEPGAALAMGVREGKAIVDCKLNIDGESKKLGPAIPRGFLSVCGDTTLKPDAKQSGRLQLAQWLASPKHPLTARVIVNRVWQHLFGEGLVRTPNDFGAYGEKPSHPELLDHLATQFMRDGWSIKRLVRSIVLSRTYQLSSAFDESLREADPDNVLLTRHNRRRLDAESVRDAMLVAAANLNPQPAQGSLIQGRDVLINELPPLHQPDTHRSIYLTMLRNSMPPELTPFNLPDATGVIGKRDDSTLATQALYLLNNDFLVEQSRRFAGRVQHSANDDAARIQFAYGQAFGRAASETETQRAHDFIREAGLMLASSQNDENKRLSDVWAAFCQALLASNELRYVD